MYDGSQFATAKTRKGVVKGYIYRILDGTNAGPSQVSLEVQRLCSELIIANNPIRDVRFSFDSCAKNMTRSIDIPSEFWNMNHDEYRTWNLVYDMKCRYDTFACVDRLR